MTNLWFSVVGFFVAETVIVVILFRVMVRLSKENDDLKSDVRKHKSNLSILVNHAEELAEISRAENDITKKIKESKSDEEVADIIADIISANNKRVRNN